MTPFEEMRLRLNGAQTDLERIESDFKKFVELKDSIEAADTSLKTSSDNLAILSSSFEKGTRGLRDCASSLQSAALILEKYDPLDIKKGQDRLGQEVTTLTEKIEAAVSETQKLPAKILEEINAAKSQRTGLDASAAALILLLVAILGISLWNLYLDHGAQILGSVTSLLSFA